MNKVKDCIKSLKLILNLEKMKHPSTLFFKEKHCHACLCSNTWWFTSWITCPHWWHSFVTPLWVFLLLLFFINSHVCILSSQQQSLIAKTTLGICSKFLDYLSYMPSTKYTMNICLMDENVWILLFYIYFYTSRYILICNIIFSVFIHIYEMFYIHSFWSLSYYIMSVKYLQHRNYYYRWCGCRSTGDM